MQGLDHSKSLSQKEVWKEVHRDSVLKMDETAVFFPEDHKFHVSAVMSADEGIHVVNELASYSTCMLALYADLAISTKIYYDNMIHFHNYVHYSCILSVMYRSINLN